MGQPVGGASLDDIDYTFSGKKIHTEKEIRLKR
jgi:hypothetical protein